MGVQILFSLMRTLVYGEWRMKNLYKILFLFAITTNAYADKQDTKIAKEVTNNISGEFTECASYFAIGSEALVRSGNTEFADKYKKTMDKALEYALIAAQVGRTAEMAQKVTLARFDIGMKEMLEEIDKDISNISILQNKYAMRCKTIMEQPERMMQEWQDKIMAKHFKSKEPSSKVKK